MDPSDFGHATERRTGSGEAGWAPGAARLERALARLVGPREPLLVGVSGGSDSMALMGLLARVRPAHVQVAHVDHGARPDSARDAAFVVEHAERLGLPGHVERGTATGLSETALRALRLERLGALARRLGTAPVLLAHHADDNRETLLLHALRGHRGLRARAGIPVWRPLAGDTALVRPWLAASPPPGRRELAAWRVALGLPCRHDPMNADGGIPRNAVRALLAEQRPPLTAAPLDELCRRSRAGLEQVVGRALARLERGLVAEGRGVLLAREAWDVPSDLDVDEATWRVELLRLVGASLEPAWRPAVSRGVLATLAARLGVARPGGLLELPGQPAPCQARLSPAGLHLPGRVLVPGSADLRGLLALARLPLP